MNAKTLEAITRHGNTLLAIFPDANEKDPVALCKKLRRIETRVSRAAEAYCNGEISSNGWTVAEEKALDELIRLFVPQSSELLKAFYINGDPRGYALKMDDAWTRQFNRTTTGDRLHSDMGGYGILAPDLTA
jgi:hypothetical protein